MRLLRWMVGLGAIATLLVGVEAPSAPAATPQWIEVCPPPEPGFARCLARVAAKPDLSASADALPGYTPLQIKKAYGYPTRLTAGRGRTIAVVSAFDAPNIEADLAVYSKQFGLPACTTKNGCFTKLFARGEKPAEDVGWALESTLDVQIAHGIAPGAKIILVEASSNSFVDLFQAIQVASGLAPNIYITNSWGGPEFNNVPIFEFVLQTEGVTEFFASGDSGNIPLWPATSPSVISVGGTTLFLNEFTGNKREIAWSGSGGGCSAYLQAAPAQAAFAQYPQQCGGFRASPDIAANGDPETGHSIYFSTPIGNIVGWGAAGGTSASAPLMAARAATTGVEWDAAYVYDAARKYYDVKQGSNGFPAGPGYDLVTGRGRWGA